MQFTRGWEWCELDGVDRPIPEEMAGARQMTLARLRVMRRVTGADFAFGWGPDPEEKAYDPRWFTLADMAVERTPAQTLIGSVTGQELIEIHERWVVKDELTVVPAYEPDDIVPERIYRIVLPPDLCWQLAQRERSLRDVEAGPEWPIEALWMEVFGQPSAVR